MSRCEVTYNEWFFFCCLPITEDKFVRKTKNLGYLLWWRGAALIHNSLPLRLQDQMTNLYTSKSTDHEPRSMHSKCWNARGGEHLIESTKNSPQRASLGPTWSSCASGCSLGPTNPGQPLPSPPPNFFSFLFFFFFVSVSTSQLASHLQFLSLSQKLLLDHGAQHSWIPCSLKAGSNDDL